MREDALFNAHNEHHGIFQAFCRVQRHQRDMVVGIQFVGVGNKCNLFQKLVNLREFVGNANQFEHVFFAPCRLHRVLCRKLAQVTAGFERMAQHIGRAIRKHRLTLVNQQVESVDSLLRRRANACGASLTKCHGKRHTCLVSEGIYLAHRCVANAALGHVQHALNAHLV